MTCYKNAKQCYIEQQDSMQRRGFIAMGLVARFPPPFPSPPLCPLHKHKSANHACYTVLNRSMKRHTISITSYIICITIYITVHAFSFSCTGVI